MARFHVRAAQTSTAVLRAVTFAASTEFYIFFHMDLGLWARRRFPTVSRLAINTRCNVFAVAKCATRNVEIVGIAALEMHWPLLLLYSLKLEVANDKFRLKFSSLKRSLFMFVIFKMQNF